MRNFKRTLTPFALLVIASCVTINVYFPAAAAQDAANEIVNEVLKQGQSDNKDKKQKQEKSKNKSSKSDSSFYQSAQASFKLVRVLNLFIPVAQAEANISINTPKINSLRNQLKQQHSQLVPYFNNGNIGYADNGLIKERNTDGLNIKEKSTVKKLLTSSNDILSNLYSEIAKANGHPEWREDIQNTFAKTWISQMQGGWMYFSGGQWKKK